MRKSESLIKSGNLTNSQDSQGNIREVDYLCFYNDLILCCVGKLQSLPKVVRMLQTLVVIRVMYLLHSSFYLNSSCVH